MHYVSDGETATAIDVLIAWKYRPIESADAPVRGSGIPIVFDAGFVEIVDSHADHDSDNNDKRYCMDRFRQSNTEGRKYGKSGNACDQIIEFFHLTLLNRNDTLYLYRIYSISSKLASSQRATCISC